MAGHEDGIIRVYGPPLGEDGPIAFSAFGVETSETYSTSTKPIAADRVLGRMLTTGGCLRAVKFRVSLAKIVALHTTSATSRALGSVPLTLCFCDSWAVSPVLGYVARNRVSPIVPCMVPVNWELG